MKPDIIDMMNERELRVELRKLVKQVNKPKCRLCDTWNGAKRYKYCPDCGRKIEREK